MAESGRLARLIAFYLPQFHPIPENDEWWGRGFTEWTNTAKAKPLFRGHVQPHVPGDLGFYDLRVPEARNAQAELAREYGVEGFCYWHYWFAGKRLLERPFNEVLASGEPDFPFCLGWANQTWTGIWHGSPKRILIEQTYPGARDYEAHFNAVLPALRDKRYITVDGKPLFLIYYPAGLPEPREFTDCWRSLAEKSGLKGLHFVGLDRVDWVPSEHGFDTGIYDVLYEFINFEQTQPMAMLLRKLLLKRRRQASGTLAFKPEIYAYERFAEKAFAPGIRPDQYPVVMPNWDNTPRSSVRGKVLQGSTPKLFAGHLRDGIGKVADRDADKRLVFVKSWNEWAEGNYLEPDVEFGRAYLEAVRDEVMSR